MSETANLPKPVPVKKKKKSKKKKFFWIGGILLVLLIVIALILSGKKETLIEVQTEKVSRKNIIQVVTATGKIQSEVKVDISAEVSGEITALPFNEGDDVTKGNLVVKLKSDPYYPRMKEQLASVNAVQSGIQSQEVTLKKNQLELSRVEELYNKGLSSQSDLDNARTNVELVNAEINRTRAQVNQQKAGLSSIQYDISKTTIYSPINGTITKLNNEVGEKVLGTVSNAGNIIMTISDLSRMECQVQVSETDVTQIKLGDTSRVQIDAFPDRVFNGYVYEISNSATAKGTGTQEEVVNFTVKIRIIDKSVDLRPGMSCTADIEVAKKENILAIPIQCVTTREDDYNPLDKDKKDKDKMPENLSRESEKKTEMKVKPKEIVFTVDNSAAKKKEVKTGISNSEYIEIIDGLKEGDEIVKGSFKAINKDLYDAAKIKVNNTNKNNMRRDDA
jgi:HlyD family secretion protein